MSKFVILIIFITLYSCQQEFHAEDWKNNVQDRTDQAEMLIENETLIGLSQLEVNQLLGDHDLDSRQQSNPHQADDYVIQYLTGIHYIDFERLVIVMKNNRVTSASINSD